MNRIVTVCCTVCMALCAGSSGASDENPSGHHVMKRRQQGILTGMPFMTNLTSRTFIDDTGRKLYVAIPPTRIASLAPSVTEMLFALGADEQVVAVTDFCDYPPEAGRKPKIGSVKPNIETLVALKADLILAPRAFIDSTVIAKLDSLKIPILYPGGKNHRGYYVAPPYHRTDCGSYPGGDPACCGDAEPDSGREGTDGPAAPSARVLCPE